MAVVPVATACDRGNFGLVRLTARRSLVEWPPAAANCIVRVLAGTRPAESGGAANANRRL